MTITLITGGNKGLGYETARRLIEIGHKVYIGARNEELGKKAADELGAKFVLLDVTEDASVSDAVAQIVKSEGRLDVLINNAGISGPYTKPEDVTADEIRQVYETNVFGIVRVTNAFLPLLRKSDAPVIVNVTSGLGSFGMVTNPETMESKVNSLTYTSSKSAVTMLTVQYAKGLPDIRINAADPGATATDLNGHAGHQTVQEGTDAIVSLATIGKDGPTGTIIDRKGTLPW
ncbi:SDR family NAD(P)-dependent oxidoreductase [Peribacillus muralis]|uniref:SDR family NAD(P)-dependent oxidoreductase n=1 Tax=Peribacillus muralis TaxID=264697 RepID=UPI001F4E0F60|nr:SDR family NAD(P)-dependent oxidoreductase [Peribacillus muralis]MCK1992345.1 SDR family NAD(P)-dependent oxidoreductase [Peribacillus muralis]MCK2012901.1 SDR family NAD(P)-dependent oxidoreductase [Peribacillus muralis]